ncbi:MAG: BamA/TamA family outer membrane protein [Novosphingobium sp.]|nr:BamA/TamA family outer membrane protein [Novosphingobium sp.]
MRAALLGSLAFATMVTSQPALAQPASARSGDARERAGDSPDDPDELRAGSVSVPVAPADAALPQVETIIPDAEFNAAIPSLDVADDPELDRPLESIEAFERAIAAKESGANPADGQAAPLDDPALADGRTRELIGDAPVTDAALNEPLPPIDEFDVSRIRFAEAASEDEDAEVRYRAQVNGLAAADGETDAHLRGLFRELSALRDGDRKAANVAMISARLAEDSVLVERILASEGWYDARVTTRIDRSDTEDGQPFLAVLDVVPGNRYTLSDIVVQARPTVPPGLIEKNLALRVGEPVVADRIQGAEAQVAIALPQNGYAFAEVGQRDILLDRETGDGVYTLPVDIGPRSRFGGFTTEGDLAFDADHVSVLARFRRGDLYDSRKVDDLRQALVATGLFSTVAVEPKRSGESAGDDTEYVTMLVRQDAGPPRTIAGTVGYGTGQGFRAEGSWTHRNLFPPEGALILHGVAGTKEQGLGATFRRSNAGQRDRTFEVVAEALHADYEAFSAYTGRVAATMSYASTPIWQKKLTYAFGGQILATAEKVYDFTKQQRDRKTYFIGGLTGQVGLDLTDDLLNPTKGGRLTALIEPEGSLRGSFHPYVRARLDASGYFPVSDSLVLAARARVGTIQGATLVEIPPSRRFYAGGGGSVRGFGFQKLGPLDPNGDPVGGRSLNEAAAEVRYRFGNFGVVGFVDVGQSYASTTPQFKDLRYGVGVGGRFYTNFGPMRLDIATPLDRRKGESRFNVYVSIGQAF